MIDPGGCKTEAAKLRKRKIKFSSADLSPTERAEREAEMLKKLAAAMKAKSP